ncbi:hypothetical protein [Streptomyces sp. NPDC018947]|uniref:hypothetical protein n=1 Tax=Streptomyces sp. NPDC018947 TaxID=3365054 RepID=UPI0037B7A58F
MRRSSHEHQKRAALPAILIAVVVTLAATACDSPDRSFSTPDNICGIPAAEDVLSSLLDDGNELEQSTGYFSLPDGQLCHMYVDGNDSVVSEAQWHERGYELRDLFQGKRIEGLRYIKEGQYASWVRGVATIISCPGVSKKGDVVSVEVRDINWSKESRALLERLIPSYFDAYKDKLGCRG